MLSMNIIYSNVYAKICFSEKWNLSWNCCFTKEMGNFVSFLSQLQMLLRIKICELSEKHFGKLKSNYRLASATRLSFSNAFEFSSFCRENMYINFYVQHFFPLRRKWKHSFELKSFNEILIHHNTSQYEAKAQKH